MDVGLQGTHSGGTRSGDLWCASHGTPRIAGEEDVGIKKNWIMSARSIWLDRSVPKRGTKGNPQKRRANGPTLNLCQRPT